MMDLNFSFEKGNGIIDSPSIPRMLPQHCGIVENQVFLQYPYNTETTLYFCSTTIFTQHSHNIQAMWEQCCGNIDNYQFYNVVMTTWWYFVM